MTGALNDIAAGLFDLMQFFFASLHFDHNVNHKIFSRNLL